VRGNFASLLRVAASRLPLPVGNATAPRSMAAADNLCDLLLRLGAGEGTNEDEDGIFHVADREDITVCRLVADIRRLLGRPQRQFALPRAWLRGAAQLTGHESVYQRLFEPLRVHTEATRTRLGWSAPHRSAEALQETVAWFRTSR
jgi:UDP-glucose 4-epimerase